MPAKSEMIIYKITNRINNKIYIGQSINFKNRLKKYKQDCKSQKISAMPIVRAMKKYGLENFIIEIIDKNIISKDELNSKESYYIEKFNSNDTTKGYNIASGGIGGDTMSNHPNKNSIYNKRSLIYSGEKVIQYRHDLDSHIEEIILLNQNGWSANKIASKFNCSRKAIIFRIPNYIQCSSKANSVPQEHYKYRKDLDIQIDSIKKLIAQGVSIKQICLDFHCSTNALYARGVKNAC